MPNENSSRSKTKEPRDSTLTERREKFLAFKRADSTSAVSGALIGQSAPA